MKILLQNLATSLFVAVSGGWTAEVEEAKKFKTGTVAIDYAVERKLRKSAVSYKFPNSKFDFKIAVYPPPKKR